VTAAKETNRKMRETMRMNRMTNTTAIWVNVAAKVMIKKMSMTTRLRKMTRMPPVKVRMLEKTRMCMESTGGTSTDNPRAMPQNSTWVLHTRMFDEN
jgi:hypothetical protein